MVSLALAYFFIPAPAFARQRKQGHATPGAHAKAAQQSHLIANYGRIPLSFEPNQDQAGPSVKFLARGPGYTLFLTGAEAQLLLASPHKPVAARSKELARPAAGPPHQRRTPGPQGKANRVVGPAPSSTHAATFLHIRLQGANPGAPVAGVDELPGKSNYYIGNNPKKWHSGIPTYARVRYRNVYPGIDLVYHGRQQQLEFDFQVAPGANPNRIQMDFKTSPGGRQADRRKEQTASPHIAGNGDLVIRTRAGVVRFHPPAVYQPATPHPNAASAGPRKYIRAGYALEPGHKVGFRIASYNHARPLVIDPALTFATTIPEGGGAQGLGLDASGNAYVLMSNVNVSVQANGQPDVVVLGINAQGNSLLYSTTLGAGSAVDPGGIAVDSAGDAYVDGTAPTGFPVTAGAYESNCPATCVTPFAAKLSPSGSLDYSTYLGPSWATAHAIAIDSSGDAYITGAVTSDDLPAVNAFQPLLVGNSADAFVQKLNPTGSQLLYSTYLASDQSQPLVTGTAGTGIAVDSSGSAYVVGNGLIPLHNPLERGVGPMFLAKFTPDGRGLVYSTQLGGTISPSSNSNDSAVAVAVDSSGDAYVTGDAYSQDFPTTMKAFRASCLEEAADACTPPQVFVLGVNPTGTSLLYSTLLGSGRAGGITVDPSGNAWVTGSNASNYFPTNHPIELTFQQNSFSASNSDAFLTQLNSSGTPTFSTFLGGDFTGETGSGVAVDGNGNVYVAGTTDGTGDFPFVNALPGSTTSAGAFLAKISTTSAGPVLSFSPREQAPTELRDVSTSPLTISKITPSSDVTLDGGTCGSSLPAGGACTILWGITDPQQFHSGTITISSNAVASPQTFTVYATPLPIDPILVSPALEFPAQLVGTVSRSQTVTLTNRYYPQNIDMTSISIPTPSPTGGIYGVFTQTNNCPASLPAGSSCNINVQYQPVAGTDGKVVGNINIGTSQGPLLVNLTAMRSSGALEASAQSVQFGTQIVGATPLPRVVTLTNTGVQPVSVSGISVGGPFTETNNCTSQLAPHASCRVAISFVPTSSSSATGQLTANFSGTGSTVTVSLAGTGEVPSDIQVSPFQISFGNTALGLSNTQPLTLTNISSSTLTLSSFNLTSDYTQTNDCNGILDAGASCTVNVTFTPANVGTVDGTLTINFSGHGSPQTVPLAGAGVTDLDITPTSLSFRSQIAGTTSPAQDLELSDLSSSPITINSVSMSNTDFQVVSNPCPNPIPRLGSCELQIAFTPPLGESGIFDGALTIYSSDSSTPHTVELSGTGTNVSEVSLSPSSLTFSAIQPGSASPPETITLKNSGSTLLTITSLAATGDFAQTNTCGSSVAAGASCTISVTFSPTAGGKRTGSVTIVDNAPDSPQSVALTGAGADFTLATPSGDSNSGTVSAGSSAEYTLALTPQGGFNKTVSFTCSGAPAKSTCTVTPSSDTLNGTNPANVIVKVTTTAPALLPPEPQDGPPPPGGFAFQEWWIALLLMILLGTLAVISKRRRVPLLAGAVLLAALAMSCGGGGGSSGGGGTTPSSPGTPAGTYTLTVTGASGSLTHEVTLQLLVTRSA